MFEHYLGYDMSPIFFREIGLEVANVASRFLISIASVPRYDVD